VYSSNIKWILHTKSAVSLTAEQHTMISCPQCKATLPDETTYCQFCRNNFAAGTASQAARRSQIEEDSGYTYPETQPLNLKWVKPVYYGIAAYWVINALFSIGRLVSFGAAGSLFGAIFLVISLFSLLVGIGLLCKVELARNYVNFICWFNILGGACSLAGSFVLSIFSFTSLYGILGMIFALLNLVLSVVMIFVIGETD